jgi:carboxypeptidase D
VRHRSKIKQCGKVCPVNYRGSDSNLELTPTVKAYYNAGSAALILILALLAIGTFIWCRIRRRTLRLPTKHTEESIPLNPTMNGHDRDDEDEDEDEHFRQRKGKERAQASSGPPIFDVGDDEDEEGVKG